MAQLLGHLTPLVQQGNLVEQLEDVIEDKTTNEVGMYHIMVPASTSLTRSSLQYKAAQAQADTQLIGSLAWESSPSFRMQQMWECECVIVSCLIGSDASEALLHRQAQGLCSTGLFWQVEPGQLHCRLYAPCTDCWDRRALRFASLQMCKEHKVRREADEHELGLAGTPAFQACLDGRLASSQIPL